MTTTNFSARLLGPPAESATAARPGENPGRAPSAQQRWATARHRLGEQLQGIDGSRAVIATAALADTAGPAPLGAGQPSLVAALTHTFSALLEAGDQLATTHHDPKETHA